MMTWMLAGPSNGQRKEGRQDFRGCPVVKTSPSNAECEVQSLFGEKRSHISKKYQKPEAIL